MDPALIPALWKYFIALYDNSAAFDEYLKAQGTDEAARKVGAKLKVRHSIVPHVRFTFVLHLFLILNYLDARGSVLRLMGQKMDCLSFLPKTVGTGT
jgi:hypothetical protein